MKFNVYKVKNPENWNQAIHQLGSKEKEIRTWILQPLLKLEN